MAPHVPIIPHNCPVDVQKPNKNVHSLWLELYNHFYIMIWYNFIFTEDTWLMSLITDKYKVSVCEMLPVY